MFALGIECLSIECTTVATELVCYNSHVIQPSVLSHLFTAITFTTGSALQPFQMPELQALES